MSALTGVFSLPGLDYRDLTTWQLLGSLPPSIGQFETGLGSRTAPSHKAFISNKGRIGAAGPYLHRTATPEELEERKDRLTAASVEVTEPVFAKVIGVTKESDGCIGYGKIELEPENGLSLLVKNKKGEPLPGASVSVKWFSDIFAPDDFKENSGSWSPTSKEGYCSNWQTT